MIYNPDKHHRSSVRLKGYDYSQAGAYFVTICAWRRECMFGDMVDGAMKLNEYGKIVHWEWTKSSEIRQEIELDEFIIMPNHIHGIVVINGCCDTNRNVGANGRSPLRMQPCSLSSFISGVKSSVTKHINQTRGRPGTPVWQRNYHDRIIRNERELQEIREYIRNNPLRWDGDAENPVNQPWI